MATASDSQAFLAFLKAISKGLAKQMRPQKPTTFIFDKPIPPRYHKWHRNGR